MKNLILIAVLLMSANLFSQDVSRNLTVIDEKNYIYDLEIDVWGDFTQVDIPETFIIMVVMDFNDGSKIKTTCVDHESSKDQELLKIFLNQGYYYYQRRSEAYCVSNTENTFINSFDFDDDENGGTVIIDIDDEQMISRFKVISNNKEL
jgi:hypothetical protein